MTISGKRGTIAIFQYEWPEVSYFIDLAFRLADAGYLVDFFMKDCPVGFVDEENRRSKDGVTFYRFDRNWLQRLTMRVPGAERKVHLSLPDDLLQEKTLAVMGGKKYRCFIGAEKKGLIWGGRVADRLTVETPLLYYSTELYIEDHPGVSRTPGFAELREEEKKCHRRCCATIIQDEMRAEALLRANGVTEGALLYFPVSLAEEPYLVRDTFLRERNAVAPDRRILLYFGHICRERMSDQVAAAAGKFSPRDLLVLHGFGTKEELSTVRKEAVSGKVLVIPEHVRQRDIRRVVASADIGLVLYRQDCANNILTAFSSEKIAYYLQCGKPIIAFENENYKAMIELTLCGELIRDLSQLPAALDRIYADYETYSANAAAAYRDHYTFSKYVPAVAEFIETLP